MRKIVLLGALLLTIGSLPVAAQQATTEAEIRRDIRRLVPYSSMLAEIPTLTFQQYNEAVLALARQQAREYRKRPQLPQPNVSTDLPLWGSSRSRRADSAGDDAITALPSLNSLPRQRPYGSSYDWRSGNNYSWRRNSTGTTDVTEFNVNTGSIWSTKIRPNGRCPASIAR